MVVGRIYKFKKKLVGRGKCSTIQHLFIFTLKQIVKLPSKNYSYFIIRVFHGPEVVSSYNCTNVTLGTSDQTSHCRDAVHVYTLVFYLV